MWTAVNVTSGGMPVPTWHWLALFPGAPRRFRGPSASALADPGEGRLSSSAAGRGRRLVLAVAPGAPGALLVLPVTAGHADHVCIVRLGVGCSRQVWQTRPAGKALDTRNRPVRADRRGPGGLPHLGVSPPGQAGGGRGYVRGAGLRGVGAA